MAYHVPVNRPVTIRHPVRDLAGALVTGQAANVTVSLSDPDAASSALPVTKTEIGASGWVSLTFTPDAEGVWILTATNPAAPTADGQVYEYAIDADGALIATGSGLLSRARLKRRLGIDAAVTKFDTLLDEVISEVSADISWRAGGRTFAETVHTRYLDGNGTQVLELPDGPLVSVTSVEHVAYSDDGAGGRLETATTVDPYVYLTKGLRADGSDGPGVLYRPGSDWIAGHRNYKVVFTAGYATVPEQLVHAALYAASAVWYNREVAGLRGKAEGDYSVDAMSAMELDRALERAVSPWAYRRGIA